MRYLKFTSLVEQTCISASKAYQILDNSTSSGKASDAKKAITSFINKQMGMVAHLQNLSRKNKDKKPADKYDGKMYAINYGVQVLPIDQAITMANGHMQNIVHIIRADFPKVVVPDEGGESISLKTKGFTEFSKKEDSLYKKAVSEIVSIGIKKPKAKKSIKKKAVKKAAPKKTKKTKKVANKK